MRQYRFTWECPRCDKQSETIGDSAVRVVHCGDCLMERTEIISMRFMKAKLLPPEPMVNFKIVGPDGEPIEGES